MCEACLAELGGLAGIHSRMTQAHDALRAQEAAAIDARRCHRHKCPECAQEDRRLKVHPGAYLSPEAVRSIEDEWVDRGLIA